MVETDWHITLQQLPHQYKVVFSLMRFGEFSPPPVRKSASTAARLFKTTGSSSSSTGSPTGPGYGRVRPGATVSSSFCEIESKRRKLTPRFFTRPARQSQWSGCAVWMWWNMLYFQYTGLSFVTGSFGQSAHWIGTFVQGITEEKRRALFREKVCACGQFDAVAVYLDAGECVLTSCMSQPLRPQKPQGWPG